MQELNAYFVKKQTIKSNYKNFNQCLKQESTVMRTYNRNILYYFSEITI